MTIDRRRLLAGSIAGAATLALNGAPAWAQSFPTVEEVLFDPQIPALGNPKGDVTIAEFFDYQCPYCKKGHADLKKVLEKDGNVRLVMKDWPIFGEVSFHAANMVLAAQETDQYEKAMDALMATPGRLQKKQIDELLAQAGIDLAALQKGYKKIRVRIDGILNRNMDQANAFGFGGTPSFIVGTRIFHGVMDEKALTQAIADARAG
ncbi:protein-disulfide isomerase [Pseudaminobacter salicylatoxidans]|uniref:Protein-disulfide isomerase n=1 Tax=Pseudaminobacter salicylatoxidans TaxID=93369 RepID=A0A316C979_PSESE|nr:DsbA family protein [Pseudaminobacter salicylatoxidans]PWJ86349.1 protein-disulfide isomerase [Pseudaminobacter salicylatoxidans]